jgi:hypothetical protein
MMGPYWKVPLWERIDNTKEFRDLLKKGR